MTTLSSSLLPRTLIESSSLTKNSRINAQKQSAVVCEMKSDAFQTLVFSLNGEKHELHSADPSMTLNDYIRKKTRFTGTKLACGEGGCGACAVMVSRFNSKTGEIEERSINSCLALIGSLDGYSILTTEGLGSSFAPSGFHSVQHRISSFHGSQCGFCTPGMCLSIYASLRKAQKKGDSEKSLPTPAEAERAISGNICRCTGYRPILDASKSFCTDSGAQDLEDLGLGLNAYSSFPNEDLPQYKPSQDPTFPQFLLSLSLEETSKKLPGTPLWFAPRSLAELADYLGDPQVVSQVRFVVGNTMSGFKKERKDKKYRSKIFVDLQHVPELGEIREESRGGRGGLWVGSTVTLARLADHLQESPPFGVVWSPLWSHLCQVAGPHVRNAASLAGNLIMAQQLGFQSDLATLLLGLGATLTLAKPSPACPGSELTSQDMDIGSFLEMGSLDPGTIVLGVFVPGWAEEEGVLYRSYRASPRPAGNAVSFVNSSLLGKVVPGEGGKAPRFEFIRLAFGAYGTAHARRAERTEKYLANVELTAGAIQVALSTLREEIVPDESTLKPQYRSSLAVSFLFSFLSEASSLPGGPEPSPSSFSQWALNPSPLQSPNSPNSPESPLSRGKQSYYFPPSHNPVSQPLPKEGALLQASGEALYVDDLPSPPGCLHGALVCSERALARFRVQGLEEALGSPGAVAFFDWTSIPGGGANEGTDSTFCPPEELFPSSLIEYMGQPIGFIVADTPENARLAASKVQIEYDCESVGPPVLTWQQAEEKNSFFPPPIPAFLPKYGDFESTFQQAENKIHEAELSSGSQLHFYMEPLCALVEPEEESTLRVNCPTQSPEGVQRVVAKCLGIPQHSVRVVTKRLGGSFGGKIGRASQIATMCALAAHKLHRPIRMVLSRAEDMAMVGGRHPVHSKYSVGFGNDGRISAIKVQSWLEGGFSLDFSSWIPMSFARAILQYDFGDVEVQIKTCKTNVSSKTAVRGPGEVQGTFLAETIIEHVAAHLNLDPTLVRERNLLSPESMRKYFPGRFDEDSGDYSLKKVWDHLKEEANFSQRTAEVARFNSLNRWRKRGLSMTPALYKIFLGSKPARVSVFRDGTIAVHVPGVEMGQGLLTKVKQATVYGMNALWDHKVPAGGPEEASRKVQLAHVRVMEQDSLALANGDMTAASSTSEICCEAVRVACDTLVARLAPVLADLEKEKKGEGFVTWEEVANRARSKGIDLSSQARNNNVTAEGRPVVYCTFGAALSEVEIDILTGATTILRCDISYDCGKSLNPAIDIGQVEGAFVMGTGFFTSEEVLVDENGKLLSNGTWDYKPPSFDTIPRELNVHLLKDSSNRKGILSSKASGEPPLLLSASVHTAIRQAIGAARREIKEDGASPQSFKGFFRLDSPATMEKIRANCGYENVDLFLKEMAEVVSDS